MLTQEVLNRLAHLNRRLPSSTGKIRQAASAVAPRAGGATTSGLPAGNEAENEFGRYWRIRMPLDQVWRDGSVLWNRPPCDSAIESHLHPELSELAHHLPRSVIFLDLETCGFAGAAVFLAGLIHHDASHPVLTQMLARNYAEEKAVLHAWWQEAAEKRVLVSFNGKSFDWPTLQDRTALHRLSGGSPRAFVHCDLLHHARRRWKRRLPNCRLQTLEQYVCGRRRAGDIPGHEVPQAYHHFVRSGDAWEIRSVLQHNALDLITLIQLAQRLLDNPT